MNGLSLILIALGLSMDTLAVSVTNGISVKSSLVKHALTVAVIFACMQALMPVLGWAAGAGFRDYIQAFDHWIAFALLTFVGAKMIYEAFVIQPESQAEHHRLRFKTLVLLSVATSIDAFAVGITFACLNIAILLPVAVIGLVTFACAFMGVLIGRFCGAIFGNKVEIIGGLVLIGIAVKILWEHLSMT